IVNDAAKTTGSRYALLDELRGLALISMIGYHAMWGLVDMFRLYAPWYGGTPGFLWEQATSWTFILLSGFWLGWGLYPVRRGLIVCGGGALVTLVSLIAMPQDLVLFGALTCLGSAMILTGLARPLLEKLPAWAGLAGSVFLFVVTRQANS